MLVGFVKLQRAVVASQFSRVKIIPVSLWECHGAFVLVWGNGRHHNAAAHHILGFYGNAVLQRVMVVCVVQLEFGVMHFNLRLHGHSSEYGHSVKTIICISGVQVWKHPAPQLEDVPNLLDDFFKVPRFYAGRPCVYHSYRRHGHQLTSAHEVIGIGDSAHLRHPGYSNKARVKHACEKFVKVVAVVVYDEGKRGGASVGRPGEAVCPLIFFAEQSCHNLLQQQSICGTHLLCCMSGGECGVIRPHPKVISVAFVNFISRNTQGKVISFMLLGENVRYLFHGKVRCNAAAHRMGAGVRQHFWEYLCLWGDIHIFPEVYFDVAVGHFVHKSGRVWEANRIPFKCTGICSALPARFQAYHVNGKIVLSKAVHNVYDLVRIVVGMGTIPNSQSPLWRNVSSSAVQIVALNHFCDVFTGKNQYLQTRGILDTAFNVLRNGADCPIGVCISVPVLKSLFCPQTCGCSHVNVNIVGSVEKYAVTLAGYVKGNGSVGAAVIPALKMVYF